MKFEVIVTLGPSCLVENILTEINILGSCIYRINGAHSGGDEIAGICEQVRRQIPEACLMVDLPGNKVRTGILKNPIELIAGKNISLTPEHLNFREFYKYVKRGDKVLANDSIYTLEVVDVKGQEIILKSFSDGLLKSNKGLHVPGIHAEIPFLFDRDLDLLKAGTEAGVDIFSLSFVRTAADIQQAKRILHELKNDKVQIFAKVETLASVKNLGHILAEVDVINVDRGDLSTDVGFFELPSYQERIVDAAKRAGKKVFLATQFLKNMEIYPVPLIAEISDLHKTIKSGISGIQLSEETAIGKYPVECIKTVFKTFYQTFAS